MIKVNRRMLEGMTQEEKEELKGELFKKYHLKMKEKYLKELVEREENIRLSGKWDYVEIWNLKRICKERNFKLIV